MPIPYFFFDFAAREWFALARGQPKPSARAEHFPQRLSKGQGPLQPKMKLSRSVCELRCSLVGYDAVFSEPNQPMCPHTASVEGFFCRQPQPTHETHHLPQLFNPSQ